MAPIQLWVKTADGALSVIADRGRATTVAQIRAKIAAMSGCDAAACRLIFAGRELEDSRSLADYDCENASELNLIIRVEEEDTSVVKGGVPLVNEYLTVEQEKPATDLLRDSPAFTSHLVL